MNHASTTTLCTRIRTLRDMTTAELREEYERIMGEPTATFNGAWLREKLARTLAGRGAAQDRVRLNRAVWSALRPASPRAPRPRDPRIPPIGTILRRDHGGEEIAVKVMRTGFKFRGRLYRSLSAIARKVTGARWNGLLWFGLADRSRTKRGIS
jgi:hypothetical protein